jgi:hypothetical protein
MKRLGLTALLLASAAGPALAAHSIGIYADELAQSCEISDPGGAVNKTFYIVHTNEVQPCIGSAWRLVWDPGMTMVWIGDDTTPFSKVGNAKDGVQVAYVPCTAGTFKIDTVTMMSFGTSAPCSYMRLGPEPTRGRVIIFCNFASVPFTAGEGIVNANGTCACTVRTEPTTWGTIKALYR